MEINFNLVVHSDNFMEGWSYLIHCHKDSEYENKKNVHTKIVSWVQVTMLVTIVLDFPAPLVLIAVTQLVPL